MNDKNSKQNVVDVDPGTMLTVVILLLFVPLILAGLFG